MITKFFISNTQESRTIWCTAETAKWSIRFELPWDGKITKKRTKKIYGQFRRFMEKELLSSLDPLFEKLQIEFRQTRELKRLKCKI